MRLIRGYQLIGGWQAPIRRIGDRGNCQITVYILPWALWSRKLFAYTTTARQSRYMPLYEKVSWPPTEHWRSSKLLTVQGLIGGTRRHKFMRLQKTGRKASWHRHRNNTVHYVIYQILTTCYNILMILTRNLPTCPLYTIEVDTSLAESRTYRAANAFTRYSK
jgi:hypothetical protein